MKKLIAIALVLCVSLAFVPGIEQADAKAKKPAKVSEVKLTDPVVSGNKYNTVTISWDKAKRASKYEVHQLSLNKAWHKYKTVKKTKKNKKKYTVKGKYKVKSLGKKYYRVYKFSKKWFVKKKLKLTTLKVSKLANGKTYSFKVRGVKGKKLGAFSKVVSIKIAQNGAITIKDATGTTSYYETKEGHDLIEKAKLYIGGFYDRGGKHLKDPADPTDNNSLDCTFFVQALFKKYVGIQLPGGKHSKMITYALEIGGQEIESIEKVAVGDLLFYNVDQKTQHVAIYAGDGKVIDASPSRKGWVDPNNTTVEQVKKLDGVYIRELDKKKTLEHIIRLLNTEAEKTQTETI